MELNQQLEAEQSILGSVLIDRSVGEQIAMMLSDEDFSEHTNKIIFQAIVKNVSENRVNDLFTIVNQLKNMKKLDEIGSEAYLTELAERTPTASFFRDYIRILKDCRIARNLKYLGEQLIKTQDLSMAQEVLDKIIRLQFVGDSALSGQDLVDYYQEQIKNKDLNCPIQTGFDRFDKNAGIYKGELTFIGALTSIGKSALGMTMAINAAENGHRVLFISSEMIERRLLDRVYSRFTGIDNTVFKYGEANKESFEKASSSVIDLGDKFRLTRPRVPTITNIINLIYREHNKNPIDMIVVDHFHNINKDLKKGESEESMYTRWMQAFNNTACELSTGILLLGQLNRTGNVGIRPQLYHFKGSSSIEQVSTNGCILHRENRESPFATLYIDKARNGKTGEIELKFEGFTTTFSEIEKDNVKKYLNS